MDIATIYTEFFCVYFLFSTIHSRNIPYRKTNLFFCTFLILLMLSRALLGHNTYDRVQSALDLTAHGDRDSESDLISIEICCCIFLTSIQT